MSALELTTAFNDPSLRSGVTQTNRDLFPAPGLTFTTSNGVFSTLVTASRLALALAIGVSPHQLQFMRQVHGSVVVRISELAPETEADAMITNVPGIVLCATIADCCAVLLHDERHHAVAAVHSGWRGTHLDVVGCTVRAMTEAFGTEARHLSAFLSPCASGERYEVGDDVAALFPEHVRVLGEGKHLFDNQSAIRAQLERAGVAWSQILSDPSCTIANLRYHSHRRDGGAAGRGVGFIGIR